MGNKMVKAVLAQLGESDEFAAIKIHRALVAFGSVWLQSVVVEALAVYDQGGLARPDGEERTLTEIFFHLVRHRLTEDELLMLLAVRDRPPRLEIEPELLEATRDRIAAALAPLEPDELALITRAIRSAGVEACVDVLEPALAAEGEGRAMTRWLELLRPRSGLRKRPWRFVLDPPLPATDSYPPPHAQPEEIEYSALTAQEQQLAAMILAKMEPVDQRTRRIVEQGIHRHGAEAAITAFRAMQKMIKLGALVPPIRLWLGAWIRHLLEHHPDTIGPVPNNDHVRWGTRQAVVQESLAQPGKVQNVKVILIGRPGGLIERNNVLVTTMYPQRMPALPKGMPLPSARQTPYTVYISPKQRSKIDIVINDPEDALIVEGFAAFDDETQGVAVFALSVTTKMMQRERRP